MRESLAHLERGYWMSDHDTKSRMEATLTFRNLSADQLRLVQDIARVIEGLDANLAAVDNPPDEPIQIPGDGPSKTVQLAVEYLAAVVQEDMGTRGGRTALYWHLVSVIQQHTR